MFLFILLSNVFLEFLVLEIIGVVLGVEVLWGWERFY